MTFSAEQDVRIDGMPILVMHTNEGAVTVVAEPDGRGGIVFDTTWVRP